MHRRLERLREILRREGLDALLVTADANRRYLSAFSGSTGSLVVSSDGALLLSDFRYQEQAAAEAPDFEFRLVKRPEMPEPRLVAAIAQELGLPTLGFEADHLSVARHQTFQGALGEAAPRTEFRAAQGLIEELRVVKDAGELGALERAIAITDKAFAAVRPLLRPEMREREVAWELEKAMRQHGAEAIAFPIIVAAGPNGAMPHAHPGEAQLGNGQPIVMDFGARVDGYHADMTRTIVLGETTEQFMAIYRVVVEAGQNAALHVRPGMPVREADALARDHIAAAGFGDYFGHGLGHGVGLAIHEAPWLRVGDEQALATGAVFSIEPGIYLPGWGGIRIEDLVVLGDDGARTLTHASKDPLVILD